MKQSDWSFRLKLTIWMLLPLAAVAAAADRELKFESASDILSLMFPADENNSHDALGRVLGTEHAGGMITLAMKFGPEYATTVSRTLPSREMRESYRDLAKYMDLFGPCQKQQAHGAEGWWSNYPAPPNERWCSEAAKLLAANLMRTQLNYCLQLLNGEAEPKQGGPFKPRPWRLDEEPVKTVWVKPDALYRVVDAAVRLEFAGPLKAHCEPEGAAERADCDTALAELGKQTVNRETAALALAKVMLRHYESVHLKHLEQSRTTVREP